MAPQKIHGHAEREIFDGKASIAEAVHTFYLDREGQPELIPTGFPVLDREVGGLGPGSVGILAAATGVGKSSAVLSAMLSSTIKIGCVSLEDGPDVVGSRLLAALSGINSMKIRRKDLTPLELKRIKEAANTSSLQHLLFSYPIAGGLDRVLVSIDALCKEGCRLIYCDYLQKVRGHGNGDRRNEVSETLTRCQEVTAKHGAALMAVSQFRRLRTDEVPGIHHLKESGDLENEARIIILAHKQESPDVGARVRFRLSKSTYGGEYVRWDMLRDPSGTLRPALFYTPEEGF
jgi:replicative DNA helicase